MKYTKRLLIERRIIERVLMRGESANGEPIFCKQCAAESEFVALDEAVKIFRQSARKIVRRADADEIHFWEDGGGQLFICRNSM